jgi:hypothetical protein
MDTPNGAFPGYVAEVTETQQQYLRRIFNEWLAWADPKENHDFGRDTNPQHATPGVGSHMGESESSVA